MVWFAATSFIRIYKYWRIISLWILYKNLSQTECILTSTLNFLSLTSYLMIISGSLRCVAATSLRSVLFISWLLDAVNRLCVYPWCNSTDYCFCVQNWVDFVFLSLKLGPNKCFMHRCTKDCFSRCDHNGTYQVWSTLECVWSVIVSMADCLCTCYRWERHCSEEDIHKVGQQTSHSGQFCCHGSSCCGTLLPQSFVDDVLCISFVLISVFWHVKQ